MRVEMNQHTSAERYGESIHIPNAALVRGKSNLFLVVSNFAPVKKLLKLLVFEVAKIDPFD